MNPTKIYFLVFLASFLVFCRSEDQEEEEEEDVDYSEDISYRVSKLKAEGAQYLQKVMEQLHNDRTHTQTVEVPEPGNLYYTQRTHETEFTKPKYVTPIYNISGPTPVPDVEAEIPPQAPPLELSKEELLALYEAALVKASQLQNGEKEVPIPPEINENLVKPALQGQMGNPVSGYYYYYFPIKSFLQPTPKPTTALKTTPTPPQQLHATITMLDSNNKAMEPLFMAITGFIGMALMFFFSVLFVPKFTKIRSKNAEFKDTPDDLATFANLALESIAGRDCSERFGCEVARIFHWLKSNNKPLRILEIILPAKISYHISHIRKAAGKKAKCVYIPCKVKKPPAKPPAKPTTKPPAKKPPQKNQKPPKKKQTPHDLWMKHFEKQKPPPKKQKQQENGWNRRKPPNKKT